jgi:hypothetical protein
MRLKTSTLVAMAVAFTLGGAIGALALLPHGSIPIGQPALPPGKPAWTEIVWPFQLDEWGKGKAFECKAAQCGADVSLYIRAKIGFCNCATGVADDEELERLSDFHLIGDGIANLGDGRPIAVAWMNGRSRSYAVAKPIRGGRSALSVAFNDRCDAIVATVVVDRGEPAAVEPGVIAFLNSRTVLSWAEVTLGL